MAQMFPEKLPGKASAGEDRIFAILKKLPDDCHVYYEPEYSQRGQKQRPDFIVIIPDVGVLIVEVKGWYPADIREANTDQVLTKIRGHEASHRHPLRQASDYMFALVDHARELARSRPKARRLFQEHGKHVGKPSFAFGAMTYLNNISRAQLARTGAGDVDAVFGPPGNLTSDEIAVFEAASPTELATLLKACFSPWWPFPPLDGEQIRTLRAIIWPEYVAGEDDLESLDDKQVAHAASMGSSVASSAIARRRRPNAMRTSPTRRSALPRMSLPARSQRVCFGVSDRRGRGRRHRRDCGEFWNKRFGAGYWIPRPCA